MFLRLVGIKMPLGFAASLGLCENCTGVPVPCWLGLSDNLFVFLNYGTEKRLYTSRSLKQNKLRASSKTYRRMNTAIVLFFDGNGHKKALLNGQYFPTARVFVCFAANINIIFETSKHFTTYLLK